jgi:methyl-accepting chemotaxis protein
MTAALLFAGLGAAALLWGAPGRSMGGWLAAAGGVLAAWALWQCHRSVAPSAFAGGLLLVALAPLLLGSAQAAAWALPAAALMVLPLLGLPAVVGGALAAALAVAAGVVVTRSLGVTPGDVVVAVFFGGSLMVQARRQAQAQRERFDIDFLVRAMGVEGAIRLDFGVVRAESEVGQRLKQVQDRMGALIRQVRGATRLVREHADALRNGGEQLRERTETSATGLRDAAMTLEQITTIVQGSADAAAQARSMAVQASEQAREGAQTFSQVAARMQDIDQAARRITEIVGVIDGIAFQTNILALNAAVEAARAGEHGRGFAVVASEVRGLALRSAQAAGQVKILIENAASTTRSGSELVRLADARMQALVQSVMRVGDVFAELSADTQQHAGSIDAVTRAVMELDQITRMNVALVETTQSVAASLRDHGAQLDEHLDAFKVGGNEREAGSMPAPSVDRAPPVSLAPSAPPVAAARPAPATAEPASTASSPSDVVEYF